jgi:hypothetical protein
MQKCFMHSENILIAMLKKHIFLFASIFLVEQEQLGFKCDFLMLFVVV